MADNNRCVYAWELRDEKIPRSVEKHLSKKSERVVKRPDRRRKVPRSDIQNGGRFRSVVKVFTVIGGEMYQGTGWLIKDDLMVTAGHLVVDECNSQNFATVVQVYIGYRGKDARDSPDVEFRRGTRVVVPQAYVVDKNSVNDFAFVKLNQPFHSVSPIKPHITPHSEDAELCVVGYPTDKKKIYVDEEEEDGAEMYEDRAQVTWNLGENHEGLLAYQIPTYGGNSGSPVLYKEEKHGTTVAIGTHVFSEGRWNFASLITEKSVNSYRSIIRQFFRDKWPPPEESFIPSSCAGNMRVEVHRLRLWVRRERVPDPPPTSQQVRQRDGSAVRQQGNSAVRQRGDSPVRRRRSPSAPRQRHQ